MVGVYIGATANMAAIMKALKVDSETFILVNAYDILICIVYFFFLITRAQKVIGRILPPFKKPGIPIRPDYEVDDFDGWDAYKGIHKKDMAVPLFLAVLLSGAIVVLSFFLKDLFPADFQTAGTIVFITALSILMSLIPAVKRIRKTFLSVFAPCKISHFQTSSNTSGTSNPYRYS
jgi:uncharacterized membrane protein